MKYEVLTIHRKQKKNEKKRKVKEGTKKKGEEK